MLISFFSHEMFKLIATYLPILCSVCQGVISCFVVHIGDIGDIWGIANAHNSKLLLNFEEHKAF